MFKRQIMPSRITAALLASGMALTASSVMAQSGSGYNVEEIVVSARKREESLQEVPVAVTALTGDFLENNFALNINDLTKYIPNVHFETMQMAGGALSTSIRGISYDQVEKANEPPVGVSLDGVFFASNSGALIDMFDIESVEVLRGPQGTLFGRNTMGGTVNITRTKPSQEFGAKLSLTAGSYDRSDVKMMFTGPLVEDKLVGKLGYYNLQSDSHTRRYETGKRDDGMDREAFVGALLWTPLDNLEIQLNADYLEDNSTYPGMLGLTQPGEAFCDNYGVCASSSYDIARANGFKYSFGSQPLLNEMESQTYSMTVNWHINDYTITSITGYNKMDEFMSVENSGSPDINGELFFNPVRTQDQRQFSQELRIASDFSGPFNFVAGVYYFEMDYSLEAITNMMGVQIAKSIQKQDMNSHALFGEMTYNLTEKARLTFGARYSYEEKDLEIDNTAGAGFVCPDPNASDFAPYCRDPNVDFDDTIFRAGIDYRFSEDLMGYFMWSQGFKSGGWVARAQSPTSVVPYDPETLDSFEVGVRSEWFERRLRLNATVFRMNYDDKQEAIHRASPETLAVETITVNGSSATIDGLELEINAFLTPNLSLNAAVGYLDAEYDKFLNSDGVDIKDQRHYNFAPEWTVNVGGNYIYPLTSVNGELSLSANYRWSDDYTTDPTRDPLGLSREVIGSYGQFDFSVGYAHFLSDKRSLKVSAFVNDALHSDGRLSRVSHAGNFVFGDMLPGRRWGVEVLYEM